MASTIRSVATRLCRPICSASLHSVVKPSASYEQRAFFSSQESEQQKDGAVDGKDYLLGNGPNSMRAVVFWEPKKPMTIEDLQMPLPKAGEVLIKTKDAFGTVIKSCQHEARKAANGNSFASFLPQLVTQLCSISAEGLHWPPHPYWKRNVMCKGQARQSRFTSTCSLKNQPASPDLSLGTSSVDQDKLDPFSLVADEMALLGHKLRSMVAAEVPKLAEAAEYFFKLGVEGKRFRPMVLLLMASSLTVENTGQNPAAGGQRARQQQIAEITEMIHVASLLHDDVLDHADTRRGISSLNHVMGNKLAVLAGDFLLSRASVALASLHNIEVVELLSKVLEHLVTGEMMQLTTETREICSMEYYMQKTFYKTASLMANSCKSIAILAEQPREVANLAFEYGRHLGLAFQLVDDSLDFIGTKASLGKPTLSDLTQGIATAPVLFALEEHPRILDLVNRKFRRSGDVDQALEMVRNSRGILRTQQLAAHHAHHAALAIASLPPSFSERVQLCRRALTELTEQVITRSNLVASRSVVLVHGKQVVKLVSPKESATLKAGASLLA